MYIIYNILYNILYLHCNRQTNRDKEIRTPTTYGCRECRISIISCSIKWKYYHSTYGREEIRTPGSKKNS